MKRLLFIAIFLGWASAAFASNSTITGTVQNIDTTPCANCVVTFNSTTTQVIGLVTYQPLIKSTSTDASGNLAPTTLPQGLVVQITVSENGQTFSPYSAIVPFLSSVTFDQMNQGILLDPLNVLASLQPPTGPVNFNNQKLVNLACPTVNGDALSWGCNATVNNLTVTGAFSQNTSGAGFFGMLTVSAIANPAAPSSVVGIGTTGATTYYYFVVCNDGNGGQTLPSASTSIINSNATLSTSNYNQIAFTIPAHALNCDILRNTSNTSVGAQSITGGLALTTSPVNDQSNTTAAYTIPARNTTGDGVFAGRVSAAALSAGNIPAGFADGDVSSAKSTTTAKYWFGSNASQYLDYGVTNIGVYTLVGGQLDVTAGGIASGTPAAATGHGDLSTSVGAGQGRIYFGDNNASVNYGLSHAGAFTLLGGILNIGSASGTNGEIDLYGSTSGHAGIAVAVAAGTPTTLVLPTTNGTAGQVLTNDGSANLSWSSAVHGQQLITSSGNFTVPAGVYAFNVKCWGSGGGSGGYGAAATDGGNGGNVTVASAGVGPSTLTCNGGLHSTGTASGTGYGGAGGTASNGTLNLSGWPGFPGTVSISSLGGGFPGTAPNSGSGNSIGQGGLGASSGSANGSGGGGGGGYAENVVSSTTPGTTFAVVVGAGGTAGTGGTNAGAVGQAGAALFTW